MINCAARNNVPAVYNQDLQADPDPWKTWRSPENPKNNGETEEPREPWEPRGAQKYLWVSNAPVILKNLKVWKIKTV